MTYATQIKSLKTNLQNPRVVGLEIEGILSKDLRILNWGWVYLPELFEILQRIFHSDLATKDIMHTPSEVYRRFGLLCNRDGAHPLLTWVGKDKYLVDGPEEPPYDQVYIPAGWSDRVIRVVSGDEKIINVTTEPYSYADDRENFRQLDISYKSRLGPFLRHQLVGTSVSGIRAILGFGKEPIGSTDTIQRVTWFT